MCLVSRIEENIFRDSFLLLICYFFELFYLFIILLFCLLFHRSVFTHAFELSSFLNFLDLWLGFFQTSKIILSFPSKSFEFLGIFSSQGFFSILIVLRNLFCQQLDLLLDLFHQKSCSRVFPFLLHIHSHTHFLIIHPFFVILWLFPKPQFVSVGLQLCLSHRSFFSSFSLGLCCKPCCAGFEPELWLCSKPLCLSSIFSMNSACLSCIFWTSSSFWLVACQPLSFQSLHFIALLLHLLFGPEVFSLHLFHLSPPL